MAHGPPAGDTAGVLGPSPTSRPVRLVAALLPALGRLALLSVLLALPGGIRAASPDPSISIVDGAYKPAALTVAQHTAVFWHNDGSSKHTVTADDGSFDSGSLNPGDAFGNVFEVAGTFGYHDTSGGSGMKGTITVTPVAATPVPTGPTPPAGTLPPDFHTPVPAASESLPAETPGSTPTSPGGTTGGVPNNGVVLGALLLILVVSVVLASVFRRRRSG